MRFPDGPREPLLFARYNNEMHMIWHQAVGPHFDACLSQLFGEKIAINLLIAIIEKDGLAPVAALGDVMGAIRDDDAGDTRHCESLHNVQADKRRLRLWRSRKL